MLGTLVQTTTTDGVKLHGFLTEPKDPRNAWILVHGVNSNFYSSGLLLDLTRRLASNDTAVLLVNTRGHDILSFNTGPVPMRVGSQIESLASSQLDLDAWFHFLTKRAFANISLLGHSLGALKSVLWSLKNNERLRSLVAVSPPRLNTEILLRDPKRGGVFREHLNEAEVYCKSGNPEVVMKVRFPLPMWVCASTYLDKYGNHEKYDYLSMVHHLNVPTLWTFGEYEVDGASVNFRNADVELRREIAKHPKIEKQTVQVIEGADHSYRDVTLKLGDCISGWASI